MSARRASSQHRDRPQSSSRRRYYEDEDYMQPRDERTSHSTLHWHHSSPQQKPHRPSSASKQRKGLSHVSRELHQYLKDDHAPEDGVPPLRRQSTQPPRRRSSPTCHYNGGNGGERVCHRRAVALTSPRRRSTPHRRRSSSRHAASVYPALRTAPVAVGDGKRASPRRSARTSTDGTPRRSRRQHEPSHVGYDSVARSPRQRHRRSSASPHRSHTSKESPIHPERRAPSSSRKSRHASTEPHARSSQGSVRCHRHSHTTSSTAPAPATEAAHRHDALRYRSSRQAEVAAKREATPHRSRRHSRAKAGGSAEKEARSPRRHTSVHRSRSSRPESRHHSKRRHRHHRTSTPNSVDEGSRHPRHTSLFRPLAEDPYTAPPPLTGSTYIRSAADSHTTGRPRSGSHIEVISVHSACQVPANGWSHSCSNTAHSPRRPYDNGPPVVIPSPRGQQIMQRIDSTRHWLQSMKDEVKKVRERELQQVEDVARSRATRHSARKEYLGSTSPAGSACRHRTSSTGSRRHTRGETHAAVQVTSRQDAGEAIPPTASSERSHRASEQVSPPTREKRHRSSQWHLRRPTAPAAAPRAPAPDPDLFRALMDSVSSSREEGIDYPILSFMSFLDGNTFDSTASLCQYNVDLADSLSDQHLDILRAAVFDHDEEAFAELLYGDDVEAEIGGAAAALGHSDDPTVQHELVVLQREAVRRFNDKCAKALQALLSAEGGLAEAVQVAASQLERQAYQADGSLVIVP
ncbi:conserved hypothetical protein [Leishmania infantum JPCM5]|uniref:Uncharacterized protein n=2 Tax=Leishmania infantum TaxID=5671 RepID=A4ICI4_LEIIN|nr:conserved hypothetical protein [Leishmania infantum JPCM5]CAC9550664.1 hypothetical_protein_-_conserved [Leishmania infantum]CAM72562.1 conserved hypothetical protein [Leishmania infantum JPCM5]SUZ46665.1 hypothetical_protein_-_conserved [Leishmania infantum]|eukprot:XP_001469453.1 conserved hypothetical protein [Leishmania infantum JPCM5]